MQFQPPSQPGWGQPEPGQQSFPEWQQQPSMYVPTPPQQQLQTGYPQWPQQQQPYYPPQPPYYPQQQQQWQQPPMMPMQPQQPPKKKTGRLIGIGCGAFVALVILIAIIAAAGSHGTLTTNTDQSTPTSQATNVPTSQPTTASQTGKIGDTLSNSVWSVTLNSAKKNQGDQVFIPSAGKMYVVVDVTLQNLSSSPQVSSSFLSFVLQDSTGQAYNEAFTDIGKPPDGTLQPNSKLRGQLVYEVPTSQHDFTFQFQDTNGSNGTWTFSV